MQRYAYNGRRQLCVIVDGVLHEIDALSEIEQLTAEMKEAARLISYADCDVCDRTLGCENTCVEAHHVEARQWLKKNGGG